MAKAATTTAVTAPAPAAAPAPAPKARVGPVLVGGPKQVRELVDSKPLMETFKKSNPTGYARIVQSFLMACTKNPKLYECDQVSIIDAVCKAVAYNLETDGVMGRAFILNRWNAQLGCQQANFQLGYKGIAEFFYRANPGGVIDAGFACEKDEFDYTMGTTFDVKLRKARGDRGQITHFFGWYRLANGNLVGDVMTVEEMMDHCQEYRSDKKKAEDNRNYRGVWDIRFDEMGTKTMVVRVGKRAPQSPEAQKALGEDELRSTGAFTIVQTGAGLTETDLEKQPQEGDDPAAPKDPPKDGENSRRMRLGSTAAGTTAATGASPAPAAPPPASEAAAQADADADVENRKRWANERAAATGVDAPLAAAPTEPTMPAAAPLTPAQHTLIEWFQMTPAEIWETWNTIEKDERKSRWMQMSKETQAQITNAATLFGKKAGTPAAAPAPAPAAAAVGQSNEEKIRLASANAVKHMATPDAQVAWVMDNRFNVPADKRAQYSAAAGIDNQKLLNDNEPDKVQEFAISLHYWLTINGKPIIIRESKGGRPGPRGA